LRQGGDHAHSSVGGDGGVNADTVKSITSAFDDIMREQRLGRSDPVATIVAKKLIRLARDGERDPARWLAEK
jgi:hypothetical protein